MGISKFGAVASGVAIVVGFLLLPGIATAAGGESRLSDEVIPYQAQLAPERPQPIEAGPAFLGTGKIGAGYEMPGGAVWQPQLLIFGTLRTAVQAFDPTGNNDERVSDWSNRLDIFAEVEVSPTDRMVVGWRPIQNEGDFTGCRFEQNADCNGNFEAEPAVAFVEFNFGEVWPNLDPGEKLGLDIEISAGRQPLLFQDGILINDTVDSVAITRNNITIGPTTNTRISGIYGFNDVHRGNNRRDGRGNLAALVIETDFPATTANLDMVYVESSDGNDGDSFHAGLSFIQRMGHFNTLFRALISESLDGEPSSGGGSSAATDGGLLFAEINWVPPRTHDNVYLNVFAGIDRFSSAVRDPTVGGPLGRTGVLFAAVGLGGYGAPLGNDVNDSAGAAIGYQKFLNSNRTWVLFEVGGRESWSGSGGAPGAVAGGVSVQQAVGQRFVARVDSFIGKREGEGDSPGWGARFEWLMKF